MTNEALCYEAMKAMKKAYAPYSNYFVGAALLTKSGKIYTGCNIENAAFSPSVCAERTAIFKAVSEGEREFERIAVCGSKNGTYCFGESNPAVPCGVCRQVMAEFCDENFEILVVNSEKTYKKYTLSELLPESFGSANIE